MKTIVVGNGGSLLGRDMGDAIDSYDQVVRFNRCPTKGFEKHVGTKTDVWVISIHGAIGRFAWPNKEPQPRTILCPPFQSYASLEGLEREFRTKFELMPIEVAKEVESLFGGYPSTGLLATYLFKPCTIIGFDHWSSKNHYGDDLVNPRSHDSDKERANFCYLETSGYIIRL